MKRDVLTLLYLHQRLCDQSWTTSTRQPSNTWDRPTSRSRPPPRLSWRRPSRTTGRRYCESSQERFPPHSDWFSLPCCYTAAGQQRHMMNECPAKYESSKNTRAYPSSFMAAARIVRVNRITHSATELCAPVSRFIWIKAADLWYFYGFFFISSSF